MEKLTQIIGHAWTGADPPVATGTDSHYVASRNEHTSKSSVDSGFHSTNSQSSHEEEKKKPKFLASLRVPLPWKASVPGAKSTDHAYKREYSPRSTDETFLAAYKQVSRLSQGPCSRVDLMVHMETGMQVAVKREAKEHRDSDIMHLIREANIQSQLKHPNIASVEACLDLPGEFIMVQEYVGGGDLFDAVVPDLGCGDRALQYIHQLCSAVAYMHSLNIVHRDIKPENICLSADKSALKLVDFGLAVQIDPSDRLSPKCGTVPYMSPEAWVVGGHAQEPRGNVFRAGAAHGHGHPSEAELAHRQREVASAVGDVREMDLKKADVWAVGVVLYTMLIGKFPWAHATFRSPEFVNYVRQGIDQGPFLRMSHRFRTLISRMLHPSPAHRISARDAVELINSWTPGPKRALQHPPAQSADDDAARKEKRACLGIPPPLSPFPNVTSCEFEWLASTNIPTSMDTDADEAVEIRPEHINSTVA